MICCFDYTLGEGSGGGGGGGGIDGTEEDEDTRGVVVNNVASPSACTKWITIGLFSCLMQFTTPAKPKLPIPLPLILEITSPACSPGHDSGRCIMPTTAGVPIIQ